MNKPINKSKKLYIIIAAALLTITNVIVLAGVAYNRSGDMEASLLLTERELSLPYRSYSTKSNNRAENSGLALKLNWNVISTKSSQSYYRSYSLRRYGVPDWLTEDKLRKLGVNVDSIKANKRANDKYGEYGYEKLDSEEIIVVLEYDGESFQTALKNAEKDIKKVRDNVEKNPDDEDLNKKLGYREESLEELQTAESRLIAIDAGLELQALKEKYNDSSKYLMLRGELSPYWSDDELVANIKQLFISSVHVPLPYSKEINEITKPEATDKKYSSRESKPRYQIKLKVGKRLEPWVAGVKGL